MLQIKNFTKVYRNGKKAANNINLSVERGDIYGFIGANGAGKTTTIKAIVGIHDFQEGEIRIDRMSIQKNVEECKKIMAYIPDNPDLYEHLTGYQYINFIADLYEVSEGERKNLIYKYSELFEMAEHLDNVISSYSHGMKQRTALIAAIVHCPKLLILDEPFVGLDPKAAYILKQIMKNITDEGGSIFFSTHVLDVAEKLCNKVAIIKNGTIVASGITDNIIGNKSLEKVFMEVMDEKNIITS